MNEIILYVVTTVIGLWLGNINSSVRKMEKQLAEKVEREEVKEMIKDKMDVHLVHILELKQDFQKIENKLDKFLDKT